MAGALIRNVEFKQKGKQASPHALERQTVGISLRYFLPHKEQTQSILALPLLPVITTDSAVFTDLSVTYLAVHMLLLEIIFEFRQTENILHQIYHGFFYMGDQSVGCLVRHFVPSYFSKSTGFIWRGCDFSGKGGYFFPLLTLHALACQLIQQQMASLQRGIPTSFPDEREVI